MFAQATYKAELMENVTVGHTLPNIRMSVTDADEPGTRNSRVEYQLVHPGSDVFVINRRTGTLVH